MKPLEIFKQIKGFEGKYEISTLGNIKGINYRRTGVEKILKPNISKLGYKQVSLRKNGKATIYYIHRLVLETFICKCPKNMECNHKNGKPWDNRVCNLEWMTHEDNVKHSYEVLGRVAPFKGQKRPTVKKIKLISVGIY